MPCDLELRGRLLLAAVVVGAVGAERVLHDQPAGLRTHTLLTIGACLFTLVSAYGFGGSADPSRLAAQIVTGIGFLDGGAIVRHGLTVKGLTTAASIWATASIGVAVRSSRLLPDTRTPFVPGPGPPGQWAARGLRGGFTTSVWVGDDPAPWRLLRRP
jgi:hypothetical protein